MKTSAWGLWGFSYKDAEAAQLRQPPQQAPSTAEAPASALARARARSQQLRESQNNVRSALAAQKLNAIFVTVPITMSQLHVLCLSPLVLGRGKPGDAQTTDCTAEGRYARSKTCESDLACHIAR